MILFIVQILSLCLIDYYVCDDYVYIHQQIDHLKCVFSLSEGMLTFIFSCLCYEIGLFVCSFVYVYATKNQTLTKCH